MAKPGSLRQAERPEHEAQKKKGRDRKTLLRNEPLREDFGRKSFAARISPESLRLWFVYAKSSNGATLNWRHERPTAKRSKSVSAILPVRLPLFDQRAQAFLRILELVKLVEEDIHRLFQSIAQRQTHPAENRFFG